MDCALINFGQELAKQFHFTYADFSHFVKQSQKICGKDAHKKHKVHGNDNTPAKGSQQLEIELFKEPLWNYAHVIGIEAIDCREVLQYCEDLRTIIVLALQNRFKNKNSTENITKLHQFAILKSHIQEFENKAGNYKKLKDFQDRTESGYFYNSDGSSGDDYQQTMNNALLPILDQIEAEYSQATTCKLRSNSMKSISIFCEILYENFKKHSKNVKYKEQQHLLTVPLSMVQHFIKRLEAFVEGNFTMISQKRYDDIDFIKTIQSVASAGKELVAEKRQITISQSVNVTLLNLLFSFAILFCMQFEQASEYLDAFLPLFPLGLKMCNKIYHGEEDSLFLYQIKIENEMVQLKMPNWNLPYVDYLNNQKEFISGKDKKHFIFLLTLTNNSPTIYEVIKMTKIVHEMTVDDHILVSPSDPEILLKFLQIIEENSIDETTLEEIRVMPLSTEDFMRYLKTLENDSNGRRQLWIKGKLCILTKFVIDLFSKAYEEVDNLPEFDLFHAFMVHSAITCPDEKIRKETIEFFGLNINYGKAVPLNSDLITDEVITQMIATLEEEQKYNNWNYLYYEDMVEWKLLKWALCESGKREEWVQIENLWKKLGTKFRESFNGQNEEPKIIKHVQKEKDESKRKEPVANQNEGPIVKKRKTQNLFKNEATNMEEEKEDMENAVNENKNVKDLMDELKKKLENLIVVEKKEDENQMELEKK